MTRSNAMYARPVADARCPRCDSTDVRPGKFGLGDAELHEFTCHSCNLWEDHRSDEPDFARWWQRWHAPARGITGPLLAAVCARPDDDLPRLALADALASTEPERAELIRLQVARAREERNTGTRVGEPGRRELDLLARHGAAWARPLEPYARATTRPRPDPGWRFERGFIGFVRVTADTLVDSGDAVFALAPIRHLDLIPGVSGAPMRPALTSPHLGRLHSLGLVGCGLDDDDAAALASNPHLGALRWLDLRDNQITERGAAALAASPLIRAIPLVLLAGNPGDPAQQYSLDWDSSVADSWLPSAGAALEAEHGDIAWLRLPPYHLQPDRFHVA
jgi:uncharacterized protein (TIGR02996 family)